MCGIIGFAGATPRSRPDWRVLWDAIHANLARGPHAWGVAAVRDGKVITVKRPGIAVAQRRLIRRSVAGASALAIHLRWATFGSPDDNASNHPHLFRNGAAVHNGTVARARRLAKRHGLKPTSGCDSEVLALLLGRARQRRRIDRVAYAVAQAREYSDAGRYQAHAMAAVWPDLLVVAKLGKPMAWTNRAEGLYFASVGPDRRWTTPRRDWLFGIRLGRNKHALAEGTRYLDAA